MPDFALYYVPPLDHPLYQPGSELLGYDLRRRTMLPETNSARDHFPTFTPAWVRDSQQYGFHMTIGHAIHFEAARLPEIDAEMESILDLFDPTKPFLITPCTGDLYLALATGWACLLRYDPNQALMMLHALVVARLAPLGIGIPPPTTPAAQDKSPFTRPQDGHRLAQYFYRPILDDFYPHFTLFNPLPETDIDAVRAGVMASVPTPEPFEMQSVCLLVRPDGDTHYHIHREYMRSGYPRAR